MGSLRSKKVDVPNFYIRTASILLIDRSYAILYTGFFTINEKPYIFPLVAKKSLILHRFLN